MKKDLIRKAKSILIDIDSCLADENFLKLVAKKISKELEVKYIAIGRLISGAPPEIATEVFLENGSETDNIIYPIGQAPCASVIINRKVQLYSEGVTDIFPGYLKGKKIESYIGAPILAPGNKLEGILIFMDVKPIKEEDLMSSICEFLAVRIGADLELLKVASRNMEKPPPGEIKPKQLPFHRREEALDLFQESLARYQMLAERRWTDPGVGELIEWRKLHEQLGGSQNRLAELINSDSCAEISAERKSDLLSVFLYKQNQRMLRSVKKILAEKGASSRGKASRKADRYVEKEETEGNHKKGEDFTTAFKVMMEQHKIIERDLCGAIKFNLEKIILPDLEKLQSKLNKKEQQALCQIIATNIVEITEPLLPSTRMSILNKLSPSELRVINLIKQGHNTKEISQILNLSPQTVATHRRNIRKKMGLTNQKENLYTVLNQS